MKQIYQDSLAMPRLEEAARFHGVPNPIGITAALGGISAPSASTPTAANFGGQYGRFMNQVKQQLPSIYQAEATYKPQYAQLGMNTISGLMPQAISTVRGMNPAATSLYDELGADASSQLGLGAALDPSLSGVLQQSIRGGQAARGMGYGPSDVLGESRAITELGNTLRQQRQSYAMGVAPMEQNFTEPALNLATGTVGAAGPTIIPTSQSQDLFNTLFNADSGMAIGNANAATGVLAGGIGSSMVGD